MVDCRAIHPTQVGTQVRVVGRKLAAGQSRKIVSIEGRGVLRREWEFEDLVACWILVDGKHRLVSEESEGVPAGPGLDHTLRYPWPGSFLIPQSTRWLHSCSQYVTRPSFWHTQRTPPSWEITIATDPGKAPVSR